MHIVALPGRRVETETWMKSLMVAMGHPEADVIRYRHWTAGVEANIVFEAECLADRFPDIVVAKSLGAIVAATAFCLHEFRPASAVLIGTPYAAIKVAEIQLLQRFAADVETLFIQQSEDPGGAASRLHTALNVPKSKVIAIPGDDHLYTDTGAIGSLIRRWNKL